MCKHVAAVLYGVGARLDKQPELLFRLRAVNENELVAHIDQSLPMSKTGPAKGKVLDADDLSSMFGLDMAGAETPPVIAVEGKPPRASRKAATRPVARPRTKPVADKKAASGRRPKSKPVTAAKRRPLQAVGD